MHVIQKSESKVNFSVASLISTSVPLLCGVKGPSCQLSNIARGSHSKALEGRGGVEGIVGVSALVGLAFVDALSQASIGSAVVPV